MKRLQPGDRVLLTKVPDFDQKKLPEDDGLSTAAVLQKIIAEQPVVRIDHIDEYGQPWFSVELEIDGEISTHTLALMDEDSWEKVGAKRQFSNPEQQALADQIDALLDKHSEAYDALAKESEQLYDAQKRLEKKI